MRKRLSKTKFVGALVLMSLLALAGIWWLNVYGEDPVDDVIPAAASADVIARGKYLATAGNCMACHTTRGGTPWAGGRSIETPFGAVYSSNLTPDNDTGIGRWSPSHFWRALHNGRSRDGRLLYPAFPYTEYTQVTRADSDAIYAYLRSVPPVSQANKPNDLRFPYNTQIALATWRALYFMPESFKPDTQQSAEWNRGAYLVRSLGHCATCHSARDALGGVHDPLGLQGGLIPVENWYAPSLASGDEAGVRGWSQAEVVQLLRTGTSPRGQVTGPMSEVVQYSTQHVDAADLAAMATYLRELPEHPRPKREAPTPAPTPVLERGAKLYANNCAQCHGERGEGVPGAYPPLAGNRAVLMANATNPVQTVLYGGFGPATEGNPKPFGMPPYILTLSDEDIAAVLTHVRSQWGNSAEVVTPLVVNRVRNGTGQ